MPGKSGLEMLAEIKKSYPKLPIIIMTAYSDLDSAVASFQGGAFEYLPKPFDIDKAIELVRRATEESEEEEQTPAEETKSSVRRRPCRKSSALSDVCLKARQPSF
jgi:two-component system nitrogen regulation response regulator GlnG